MGLLLLSLTAAATIPSVPVAPGVSLPLVSLGTGSGQHADVAAATKTWLGVGGRAIDTAYFYRDESDIAQGIAEAGVARGDIFITTKIMCGTYDKASAAIDSNLKQLSMASVNLTLIHFDKCYGAGSLDETWRALEDAHAECRIQRQPPHLLARAFVPALPVTLVGGERYMHVRVFQIAHLLHRRLRAFGAVVDAGGLNDC